MIEELAERANRAIRTFSARNTAEGVHAMVAEALESNPGAGAADASTRILEALASRRGWMRRNDREFICTFGDRSSVMNVPTQPDVRLLARLITRIEVNVFLGAGVDHALMPELQALAQRELEQAFERPRT
jgi:hypothetical protein